MSTISAAAFADTKPHYDILDGLRGIAALTVVWFHIFEAFATSHLDQRINHGYLAVDFFFILSGFVIGYAYDDRWKKMTVAEFLKRRLIRLHPMVVIGALIGAVMFYFQGCSVWDVTKVTVPMLLAATLMNACLIPASPGTEIRGLSEMYPLNGPSWSLFFEYAGNILYAFFIRKLSTRALSVVVFLAGCGLAAFAVWGPLGDICVGFAMTEENMVGGSLRLMFAFSAGLLLSRVFKPVHIRGAFWICSLCVVALLSVPRIGGSENLWMNGLYDTFCAVVAFPLLVFLGASGKTTDQSHRPGVQIPGGHILSPLHGALSLHIPLLRLGQERRPHVPGVAARCPGAFLRFGNPGMAVPEAVRRTGAQIFIEAPAAEGIAPQAPRPGAFPQRRRIPRKATGFCGDYMYIGTRQTGEGGRERPGRFRKKTYRFRFESRIFFIDL